VAFGAGRFAAAVELLVPAAAVAPPDATWVLEEGSACVLAVGGAMATIGVAWMLPVSGGGVVTTVVLEQEMEGVVVVVVMVEPSFAAKK